MTKFNVGNVGDKVRILDGKSLIGNSRYRVTSGKEYEIVSFHEQEGTAVEHIKVADNHSNLFALCDYEYKYIELVEKKLTKNQRITILENEVAELKLIVHELRERPQLTTVVNNVTQGPSTTNTVEVIIELEGKQYRKVDRKARVGDVVIFRKNTSICVSSNKPYLVSEVLSGMPKFYEDGCRYCVYFKAYNRTFETTDVYEIIKSKSLSPNQQRAEIIEKAKAFIKSKKVERRNMEVYINRKTLNWVNAEFIVNEKKKTVVCLIRWTKDKSLDGRGVAKCNPSDVFNEHIGKAIALGRALGLDVSEFEQAVQPTEKVLGMIVEWRGEAREISRQYIPYETCNPGSDRSIYGTIINDTNAIYGGVE